MLNATYIVAGLIFPPFPMLRRHYSLLFACLLIGVLSACDRPELVTIHVGGTAARVELALTPGARQIGLMQRERLAPDQGMLFVFPQVHEISMWMLNVQLPLDVGFFGRDGRLLGWRSMAVDGGKIIYKSPTPALYALEMNVGWFAQNGLTEGAMLQLPFALTAE